MKEFDVNRIVNNVQKMVGDLGLENLGEEIRQEIQQELQSEFGNQQRSARPLEQEFRVETPVVLELHGLHGGDVTVEGTDEPVVRVRTNRYGAARKSDQAPFRATREGNRLRIEPGGLMRHSPADYHITVPRNCRLDIRGLNAEIRIRGTRAGAELETVSGEIALHDVQGDCSIRTVSGDVEAEGIVGRLSLESSSGDVTVRASRLEAFVLRSASGDFDLDTSLGSDGEYLISTASGDVRLRVPVDTGARILLKTHSGDVMSELPANVLTSTRSTWEGEINGGGARVEMSSQSGDLHILASAVHRESAAPAPPASPSAEPVTPPPPPEPPLSEAPPEASAAAGQTPDAGTQDPTATVLEALERGEISVEEAMARLEAER